MGYAPGVEEFVKRCDTVMPPGFYTGPVASQREMYHALIDEFRYPRPDDVHVFDTCVQNEGRDIAVRVYDPSPRRSRGALLYVRGGGFVVGSLATHDTVVAELASKTGMLTFAVDYRLAPEHPFPAAVEDTFATLLGVVAEVDRFDIDPDRIGIVGDSSGANLAVVTCLMTRDRGGPTLRGQGLISPVLDFTRWQSGGEDAPLLTGGEMEYYTRCYVTDPAQLLSPYVSPLCSASFHDLPPAYIMSAEMDSLRVDAAQYAAALREHGIFVQVVVEPGLVHSAVRARGLSPQVADAWDRFCARTAWLIDDGPGLGNGTAANGSLHAPSIPAVVQ